MDPIVPIKSALCVGVSLFDDRKFGPLPAATETAREIANAIDVACIKRVHTLADPKRSEELFVALQKAIRDARNGTFIFYFAGHVLRRGDDWLLAVGDSELDESAGCVPWSDIEYLLLNELVSDALVILNVDQSDSGAGGPKVNRGGLCLMGPTITRDGARSNAKIQAYGDAVVAALKRPAAEMRPYLSDGGRLDVAALGRYLAARVGTETGHAVWSQANAAALVMRDLGKEIEQIVAAEAAKPAPAVEVPAPAPAPAPAPTPTSAESPAAPVEAVVAAPKKSEPPVAEPDAQPAARVISTRPERELASAKPAAATSRIGFYAVALAVVVALIYWLTQR